MQRQVAQQFEFWPEDSTAQREFPFLPAVPIRRPKRPYELRRERERRCFQRMREIVEKAEA